MSLSPVQRGYLTSLCENFKQYNYIDPENYKNPNVKRGLRNSDGTGVLAGFTLVGNVYGYKICDGQRVPDEGKLFYRGYDVNDITESCAKAGRHGFEEVIFLLLFGKLPTETELTQFWNLLAEYRELPQNFIQEMIMRSPSRNIMNKLARNVLSLYSFDDNPDDHSLENVMSQCIMLIARIPMIATYAFQAKRHRFDKESLYIHFADENMSTSQNILRTLRNDTQFTRAEADILDLALILHAEHGGGNNSTFASRVLASAATDTYAAMSAAISSLKGFKHGGANIKVVEMMNHIKAGVNDWVDEAEVSSFLKRILKKEAGDKSGLIYGMGHAVYTYSDPRAVLLKAKAKELAKEKGMSAEYAIIELVERLAPAIFKEVTGQDKVICANVDLYSGFVYEMLGIPTDLYTPLFAIARVAGWSAHIIEEFSLGGRIMRPAYKSVSECKAYVPLGER